MNKGNERKSPVTFRGQLTSISLCQPHQDARGFVRPFSKNNSYTDVHATPMHKTPKQRRPQIASQEHMQRVCLVQSSLTLARKFNNGGPFGGRPCHPRGHFRKCCFRSSSLCLEAVIAATLSTLIAILTLQSALALSSGIDMGFTLFGL